MMPGCDGSFAIDGPTGASQRPEVSASAGRRWIELLAGRHTEVVWRTPAGEWGDAPAPQPRALLSGAFNPRHTGHVALRRAAEQFLGVSAGYELPLINADKPAIDVTTAIDRCQQFDDAPLAVTRAATFVEKARLFPESVFIVGVDTALRILDDRFYPDGCGQAAALDEVRHCGCRFLVAPRLVNGRFLTWSTLEVPRSVTGLFVELPAGLFRSDVSSTALRTACRD